MRRRIDSAALLAGRDPAGVRLVAVSKQHPAAAVRAAAAAGQVDFGENYLQDALPKLKQLSNLQLVWHFIGHVQSNKTRDIAENFQWVHTVDRAKIAARLSEQRPPGAGPLQVLIQVRLRPEEGKGGIEPTALSELAETVTELPGLQLRGLMCIPPPSPDSRSRRVPFAELRGLLEELNRRGHDLDTLSMGMSDDLEAAIAEGATIVRVGTAVFGPRE